MQHNTAPCATRGVAICCTTLNVTLTLPCFGMHTTLQFAAWITQIILVRTQGIFGPKMNPAAVTALRCATLARRFPVMAHNGKAGLNKDDFRETRIACQTLLGRLGLVLGMKMRCLLLVSRDWLISRQCAHEQSPRMDLQDVDHYADLLAMVMRH